MNIRQISNKELADISNDWENPTVDIKKYYQNVIRAWEVNEKQYQKAKRAGILCQQYNGKFYIA